MAQLAVPARVAQREQMRAIGGVWFDWAVVVLGSWFIGGLYLDGWAHVHIPTLETFFTPWHGVLYSGFSSVALLLAGTLLINRARGVAWTQALPAGYQWSLIGAGIFVLAGVGDMIWHILFGIERSVEALLSPTHLMLALGGLLIGVGPLCAAWGRTDRVASWPAILSLTFLLALFSFFTLYIHPFADTTHIGYPQSYGSEAYVAQALGVGGILLQSGVLVAIIGLVMRRWGTALPIGSLTVLIALPIALLGQMNDIYLNTGPLPLLIVGLLAGIAADGLRLALRPGSARPGAWRLFAFLVPVMLYTLYMLALQLTGGGTWWAIHLWTGAVVLAGATGWLVSYLLVPPAMPNE